MVVISKTELDEKEDFYIQEIREGKVIVYPTDTIYGIGCDATNTESVKKIRELKQRQDMPFTIIPPSADWIKKNCDLNEEAKKIMKNEPGATLIIKLKNKKAISDAVNLGLDTVGIRIPDHWFTKTLQKTDKPIVTTSVNKTGQPYMTSMNDLDDDIWPDYIFYEGEKKGKPSKIFDVTGKKVTKKR
jgi:L-threonylcarbamoyladenylate synthase